MTSRVGYVMSKIMGDHYGDQQFDVFDFIPLIGVLIASALLLSGLFPTGLRKGSMPMQRVFIIVIN